MLKEYFTPYLELLNKATGKKVFMVLLAIIAMQGINSIRYLYQWFMGTMSKTGLNAYYYLFSYTELPLDLFMRVTIRIALSCIPEELRKQAILFTIDDTLQEKYGTKFESYQKYFDHSKRTGSNYLNGHCFVGMTISVAVWFNGAIRYLSIPVGYRLRGENENKLEIASKMIEIGMEEIGKKAQVILLCDSWYPKGEVLKTVAGHKNLEIIANVRVDSVIHDLPVENPKGKRGPKPKKGKRLDIHKDFKMKEIDGGLFAGARKALTNLFEEVVVYVTVTARDISKNDTYRVFISTLMPEEILMDIKKAEKDILKKISEEELWVLPFQVYRFRWNIEVIFYEHKKFWSVGTYMLRNRTGIENYTNLIVMVYSAMKILPYINKAFSKMKENSIQERRYMMGEWIKKEINYKDFVDMFESGINSSNPWEAFNSMASFRDVA
jgi:hypothetical protein